MDNTEIWVKVPIKKYENNYEISNCGRIKSLPRLVKNRCSSFITKEHFLKPQKLSKGYFGVRLYKKNKGETLRIHRLVYEAFIGPIPKGYDVNHIDEDKTNNFVYVNPDGTIDFDKSNLNLMTKEENNAHGTRNERIIEKCGKPVIQYTLNGEFVAEYPTLKNAERKTGIYSTNISSCCNGKYKTSGGYIWKWK